MSNVIRTVARNNDDFEAGVLYALDVLGMSESTFNQILATKLEGNKGFILSIKYADIAPSDFVDTGFTESGVKGSIDDGSGPVENLSQYTKYTDGALWDGNGKAKEGGFDAPETKGDIE